MPFFLYWSALFCKPGRCETFLNYFLSIFPLVNKKITLPIKFTDMRRRNRASCFRRWVLQFKAPPPWVDSTSLQNNRAFLLKDSFFRNTMSLSVLDDVWKKCNFNEKNFTKVTWQKEIAHEMARKCHQETKQEHYTWVHVYWCIRKISLL